MQTTPPINIVVGIPTLLSPPADGQQYTNVVIYNETDYTMEVSIASGASTDWLQSNYADSYILPTQNSSLNVVPQTPNLNITAFTLNLSVYIGLVTATWYLSTETPPRGYPLPLTGSASGIANLLQNIPLPVWTAFSQASPIGVCSIGGNIPNNPGVPPFVFQVPDGTKLIGLTTSIPNQIVPGGSGTGIQIALRGYSTKIVSPYVVIPNTAWSLPSVVNFILSEEFDVQDCNDTIYEILIEGLGISAMGTADVILNELNVFYSEPLPPLQNLIQELYVVPTVPSTLSGDRPPNELAFAQGNGGVSTLIAAPGAGKQLRLFKAKCWMFPNVALGGEGYMYAAGGAVICDVYGTNSFAGYDEADWWPSGLESGNNPVATSAIGGASGPTRDTCSYTTEST